MPDLYPHPERVVQYGEILCYIELLSQVCSTWLERTEPGLGPKANMTSVQGHNCRKNLIDLNY